MKTLTVNPDSKTNVLRKIGVPNSLVETIEKYPCRSLVIY